MNYDKLDKKLEKEYHKTYIVGFKVDEDEVLWDTNYENPVKNLYGWRFTCKINGNAYKIKLICDYSDQEFLHIKHEMITL